MKPIHRIQIRVSKARLSCSTTENITHVMTSSKIYGTALVTRPEHFSTPSYSAPSGFIIYSTRSESLSNKIPKFYGSSVSILTVNTSGLEIVKNHQGAMMELGEAVCKLRKLDLVGGPFHQFEREISDVLEFIYQTQLELVACNEDLCIAMEQTEIAYKLLGSFAAKEKIYNIEINDDDGNCYIVFHPARSYGGSIHREDKVSEIASK